MCHKAMLNYLHVLSSDSIIIVERLGYTLGQPDSRSCTLTTSHFLHSTMFLCRQKTAEIAEPFVNLTQGRKWKNPTQPSLEGGSATCARSETEGKRGRVSLYFFRKDPLQSR